MRFSKSFCHRLFLSHISRGILCFILLAMQLGVVYAQQTINLSQGDRPRCSTNDWNVVNNRYHCVGGDASITILPNRSVVANSASALYAEGGIVVHRGSQVGTPTSPISLSARYNSINIERSVINGNVNLDSGAININNSVVNGSASTSGIVDLNSSSIQGDIVANNGVIASNNSSVIGDISASTGSINIHDSESIGFLTTGCCTITGTNSSFSGGAVAQSGISITGGRIEGDYSLTSNNTISLTGVEMPSGSIDAWNINIDNTSRIGTSEPVFINIGNNLNAGDDINAICDPQQDRCIGSTAPPPSGEVDHESLLPMCTDIWQASERENNRFYPQPNFSLPEDALRNTPVPQNLQPTDYLRRGNFTAVNNDWSVGSPTARIYADGDLTLERGRRLNANGPPERLILVVTGDLTIEPDVVINGYIYVSGRVNFSYLNTECSGIIIFVCIGLWQPSEQVAVITGAITSGREVSRNAAPQHSGSRRTASIHDPSLNYVEPRRAIQGGSFCLGQPRQELWLEFSDSNWSASPGSVVDSSPHASPRINEAEGFSFPSTPLDVRAPRAPSFGAAGFRSALPANTQNDFFGTCSYADFDRAERQFFEVQDSARLDFDGSFTIGAWVYPESHPATGLMTIASKDENYEFHITSNGQINWWWHNSNNQITQFTSEFASPIPTQQWSYVGIRYTPTTQTIFAWDGSTPEPQQETKTFTTGLSQNDIPLLIGGDHGSFPERAFHGRIDEFRVFKGAITDAEIRALGQERASECGLPLTCNAYDFSSHGEFPLSWQTARSSGNFTPEIERGRLRLNEAVGDQATVAALRRAFPAANNYIEVTFDFYAYAGNRYNGSIGGDGIAVVFSDASVVPVPGSYGGSLGYAQRDTSGGGVEGPGFAGGWLGVGLDIYGNFAQPTEGRVGGLSTSLANTRNRVSLRGASDTLRGPGEPGYEFIAASPQLEAMSSDSAQPPAQPDRYRIIIDSRRTDESRIIVQRRRSGTSVFTPVIEHDLDDQQPSVPDLLRISFTGSTGGAFSVHEIDNLEVCALRSDALGTVLDHVRLSHSGELVSCFNETIQVQGCLNDDCSQPYTGAGNVVVQASQGQWTNTIVNEQNASIPLVDGYGRGSANLRLPEGGTASFTLLGTDPLTVSNQPLRCYLGNVTGTLVPCDVLFKTAGLEFVLPDDINVRDQRPIIAGVTSSRALRTAEANPLTGACEARVEDQTLPTDFKLTCLDPDNCVGGQSATINGTSFLNNYQSVNLDFNQQGVATLNDFIYSDVGQIQLDARLNLPENPETGGPAVELSGTSMPFVSVPYSLNVFALNDNGDHRTDLSLFKAAGEPFTLAIESRNAAGITTPSFGNETQPVDVTASFLETIFPSNGFPGELNLSSPFERTAAGIFQSSGATWSEVGSFSMQAELRDNLYLGVNTENRTERPAGNVGQFFPHHYQVQYSMLLNGCTDGDFTYMAQPAISLDFDISANNSGDGITQNYGYGDYAGSAEVIAIASSEMPQDQADDNFPTRFAIESPGWNQGELNFFASDLAFARRDDQAPDGPYPELYVGLQIINAEDARTFLSEDFNGVSQQGPTALIEGSLDMRYGRLVLENTFGPETEDLSIELRAEYWDGDRFQVNMNDNCTPVDFANLNIISNPDNVATTAGGFAATLESGMAPFSALVWQAPRGPNTIGEIEFEYQAPPWLRFPWEDADGDSYDNPRAFAGFGQYRGNDRIIFWLELGQ